MSPLQRCAAVLAGAAAVALPAAASASGSAPVNSTGTITVSLTSPPALAGTASASAVCVARVHAYRVTAQATDDGLDFSVSDVIAGYAGAGSYQSRAVLTVRNPSTGGFAVATRTVPVTIGGSGAATSGSISLSKTFSGTYHPRLAGKTLAGTVSWTCGS